MTITTKFWGVPGQMGPYYSIASESHGMAALDAILQKPGAKDLVTELYKRMENYHVLDQDMVPQRAGFSGGMPALDTLLKTQGADNLIGELHRRMQRIDVPDVPDLFDTRTAGMVHGPASVIRGMKESVQWGTADNYTYHFAMTAIVYAMALEELDPNFFKDKKHLSPQDHEGYEAQRQKILDYVKAKHVDDNR